MALREVVISGTECGGRLDKYLLKYLSGVPKPFIYRMLRKKRIKLNGKRAEGNEILNENDILAFYFSYDFESGNARDEIKKTGGLEIIYEDDNIIVINKPAGLLCHSETAGDDDTLVDRVLYYLSEKGEVGSVFRPAIANRLDRNTSGIVLCGKNITALRELNFIIKTGLIEKYYVAAVAGEVATGGVLKGYHEKDGMTNVATITDKPTDSDGAKEAVTVYKPLVAASDCSLLEILLVTGRSHQIRVHLRSINHPVIGDAKYGDKTINEQFKRDFKVTRQLLHARRVVFKNASGVLGYLNGKEYICALPADIERVKAFIDINRRDTVE